METIVTIRCKAFTNGRIEDQRCMVESDGTVRVYDSVAGHYTTCHTMSESAIRRARTAARKQLA